LASEGQNVKVLGKSKNLRRHQQQICNCVYAPGPHTIATRQKTETTRIENETGTGGRESYSEELENCKPVGTPGSLTLASNTMQEQHCESTY